MEQEWLARSVSLAVAEYLGDFPIRLRTFPAAAILMRDNSTAQAPSQATERVLPPSVQLTAHEGI